jgi:hypothetical protein
MPWEAIKRDSITNIFIGASYAVYDSDFWTIGYQFEKAFKKIEKLILPEFVKEPSKLAKRKKLALIFG